MLPFRLRDLKESLGRWQDGLAEVGWNSLYWGNHDQPRVVSRFGDDGEHRTRSAKALATVLHLHRGTPYVYQGEEIGMTQRDRSPGSRTSATSSRSTTTPRPWRRGEDPDAVLAALRVDEPRQRAHPDPVGCRRAAPASRRGRRGSAINPDFREVNVAAERADEGSVLHHYRRLIALRHQEPAVVHGDFTMLLPEDEQVYAFTRRHGDVELLVLVNVSGGEVAVEVPDAEAWSRSDLLLGTVDDADGPAWPATAASVGGPGPPPRILTVG